MPDISNIADRASTYGRDLTERVVTTFVQASAAVVVAAGPANMLNLSFWQGAGVAGMTAVGALLKGLVARNIGNRNSASVAPRV